MNIDLKAAPLHERRERWGRDGKVARYACVRCDQPHHAKGLCAVHYDHMRRRIDPRKLPGTILLPTYRAHCVACKDTTQHAGLGGDEGREIGSYCLACGTAGRK